MNQNHATSAIAPPTQAKSLRPAVDVSIAEVLVRGQRVRYTTGGEGPSVLFLHGWGLGHHAYRRGLRRLANLGLRVVAPALPGFGGTQELPTPEESIAGYSAWLGDFAAAARLTSAIVVGHSFGGGVAIRSAVDQPGLIRGMVLLNSIGGRWQNKGRSVGMGERPWWDWSKHVPGDVAALLSNFGSTMPSVLEDLVPNVVRNPLGVAKVGRLARNADLATELAILRSRALPASVVHSGSDGVVPHSCFDSICEQLGVVGEIVPGNHSWPLTHPDVFAHMVHEFACRLPAESRS